MQIAGWHDCSCWFMISKNLSIHGIYLPSQINIRNIDRSRDTILEPTSRCNQYKFYGAQRLIGLFFD